MATFLNLYNQPPTGTMHDAPTNTKSTAPLTHALSADLLPNHIMDSPDLAENLAAWARQYIQNHANRQPSAALQSLRQTISTKFNNTFLANEGTVAALYHDIELFSEEFAREAEQQPTGVIRLAECTAANWITSDWEWLVQGQGRMVVEHKRRKVFGNFCNAIRGLAMANNGSGSVLELDNSGHAKGELSILLKLGRQMIADDCQLGMLFGGHRFIIFALYDAIVNGQTRHYMLCSRIHETVPTDNSADAIQVTIAVLLGRKDAFFRHNNIPFGITAGLRDTTVGSKTRSEAKGAQATKGKATAGGGQSKATHVTRVKMSYAVVPGKEYIFDRVDTEERGETRADSFSHDLNYSDSAADLVLYDPIGVGICGSVFDADLTFADGAWSVAAKFFDPVFLPKLESGDIPWEEAGTQSLMFKNETEVYKRLAETPTCLPFLGAFYGKGFTGYDTYLILLEKLAHTFNTFSDMTQHQRETAYNFVVELHKQKIHHGDVEARNFGLRASALEDVPGSGDERVEDALVIYDFSHASVFGECDPNECLELQSAREDIIENCQ